LKEQKWMFEVAMGVTTFISKGAGHLVFQWGSQFFKEDIRKMCLHNYV
jgi:hypothetical protein